MYIEPCISLTPPFSRQSRDRSSHSPTDQGLEAVRLDARVRAVGRRLLDDDDARVPGRRHLGRRPRALLLFRQERRVGHSHARGAGHGPDRVQERRLAVVAVTEEEDRLLVGHPGRQEVARNPLAEVRHEARVVAADRAEEALKEGVKVAAEGLVAVLVLGSQVVLGLDVARLHRRPVGRAVRAGPYVGQVDYLVREGKDALGQEPHLPVAAKARVVAHEEAYGPDGRLALAVASACKLRGAEELRGHELGAAPEAAHVFGEAHLGHAQRGTRGRAHAPDPDA
mmetsp:Transcript_1234/g.3440  ORF Transcript_1234/g.3440 Transcript_1234/m.3440 type:complete len:283 (-) Transcript_1234:417-1265(-)